MNPSPQVRAVLYLLLAVVNAVTFVFMILTNRYTPDFLLALTGFNALGLALANANVNK